MSIQANFRWHVFFIKADLESYMNEKGIKAATGLLNSIIFTQKGIKETRLSDQAFVGDLKMNFTGVKTTTNTCFTSWKFKKRIILGMSVAINGI